MLFFLLCPGGFLSAQGSALTQAPGPQQPPIMPAHDYERIAAVYTLDNYPLLISSLISAILGFIPYFLGLKQLITKGTTCVPFWVHTAFLAHDVSLGLRSVLAGVRDHDHHWYLVYYGGALLGWTCQELFSIYLTITNDALRQEVWGPYRPRNSTPVSKRDALLSALKQAAGFIAIFNYIYERFDATGAPQFDWFILSIVLDSWGSIQLWRTRATREHCNLTRAKWLVVEAVWTFLPWNMWWVAFPDLYDTFWFRAMGLVTVGCSIANLKVLLDLPEAEEKEEKNKVT